MEYLIDGKLFSTNTSKQVAQFIHYSHGPIECVYLSPKGVYWIGWERTNNGTAKVISKKQAMEFCIQHHGTNSYRFKEFFSLSELEQG